MDAILENLYMAECELANYVELSLSEEFFESDNPEKAQTIQKNSEIEKKASSGIANAIRALLELIKRIITSIADFITGKSRRDKKKSLEDAENALKANPEIADKKVTVTDNKAYNEALDKAIKEADDALRQGADPSLANSIMERLSKVASAGSTQVAVDVALSVAKNDVATARLLSTALHADQSILEKMEKDLGSYQASKLEKKLKDYSKNTFWRRFGIKLREKRAKTAMQEFDSIVNGVLGFVPGTAQHDDNSLKMMKNKAKVAGMVVKNETLRDAAIDSYGAYRDGKKTVKKVNKQVNYYKGMANSGLKTLKKAFTH